MPTLKARAVTYAALSQLKTALDEAVTPEDFLAQADEIIRRPRQPSRTAHGPRPA